MKFNYTAKDAAEIAEKYINIPGWEMYTCYFAENGCMITGQIRDDPSSEKSVVVSMDDIQQAAVAYQEETGNCWQCKGEGKVIYSWHYKDGTKHKECPRCKGSGKAVD